MSLLTKHPEGSARELWSVSYPLMISTLASLFMIFTDRAFLSHYSPEALNASVNAGTLAWAFIAGFGMITAMSEVFVAQYNGAKEYHRIGIPVWQMVWFGCFSCLFFLPMAFLGSPLIFQGSPYAVMEETYFGWLMLFGPSHVLLTAFAGFFIGRGKAKILTWIAILANALNILLDRALIFGIEGIVPELGIQGAAIATCFGYFIQSAILAYVFLKKENQQRFGTHLWKFHPSQMVQCLKIGIPQGIFCGLEIFGWAVFYWMMTTLGEKHITVASVCQSFIILLSFFCDGLSKGASAVSGNLIGAGKPDKVSKVFQSGMILLLVFSLVCSSFFLFEPLDTVDFFFFNDSFSQDAAWKNSLKDCMALSLVYLFFDGARWVLGGILASAGDTLFLLIFGSLSVWLFLLIPVYALVVRHSLSIEYAWGISVLYALLFFFVYYLRFYLGAWQKIRLREPEDLG